MTWALFLDDERFPVETALPDNCDNWTIARNHQDVIDIIEVSGFPAFVSFDHDLGDFIKNGNGYVVAKYLCDLDMNGVSKMPSDFCYYVHSQNPIGKANIIGYLDNYMKFKKASTQ